MDKSMIPNSLVVSSNLSENWKLFRQRFEIYMKATEAGQKSDDVKVAILLNIGGEELLKIYNNLKFEEKEDKEKLDKVLQKIETYCNPRKNVVYERYVFYKRIQREGEPFDNFYAEIQKLGRSCEFKDVNEQLRDKIVLGIADRGLQEKLLAVDNITYEKSVEICRTYEVNKRQANEVQKTTHYVEEIKKKGNEFSNNNKSNIRSFGNKFNDNYRNRCNSSRSNNNNKDERFNTKNYRVENLGYECKKCLRRHVKDNCIAKSLICHKCNRKGHLARA